MSTPPQRLLPVRGEMELELTILHALARTQRPPIHSPLPILRDEALPLRSRSGALPYTLPWWESRRYQHRGGHGGQGGRRLDLLAGWRLKMHVNIGRATSSDWSGEWIRRESRAELPIAIPTTAAASVAVTATATCCCSLLRLLPIRGNIRRPSWRLGHWVRGRAR